LCTVQVQVTTAKAVYTLGKAAAAYRTIFQHMDEAVAVTVHCYMALTASAGGNPQASLSEVIAKLARAKVFFSPDAVQTKFRRAQF
jgi:Cytosine specific DNA methyltransferase replication foci domain